jgi:hypothetical protein
MASYGDLFSVLDLNSTVVIFVGYFLLIIRASPVWGLKFLQRFVLSGTLWGIDRMANVRGCKLRLSRFDSGVPLYGKNI